MWDGMSCSLGSVVVVSAKSVVSNKKKKKSRKVKHCFGFFQNTSTNFESYQISTFFFFFSSLVHRDVLGFFLMFWLTPGWIPAWPEVSWPQLVPVPAGRP